MTRYLGAHTIANGGISMAALRAGSAGMKALQIFTAPPQYYGDKATMKPDRVQRFRAALDSVGIAPEQVVVHAAYVLNTATEDPTKSARARAGLTKELERSTALGVGGICFHPGAAIGGDRSAAASRVAEAITEALEQVEGKTRVLVENTAGAGTTIGRTAEEVGAILAGVPTAQAPHRLRLGYLPPVFVGTRYHPLGDRVPENLDLFEEAAGCAPSFFHLNDSEGALGSNKDRHVLIGQARLGERRSAGSFGTSGVRASP